MLVTVDTTLVLITVFQSLDLLLGFVQDCLRILFLLFTQGIHQSYVLLHFLPLSLPSRSKIGRNILPVFAFSVVVAYHCSQAESMTSITSHGFSLSRLSSTVAPTRNTAPFFSPAKRKGVVACRVRLVASEDSRVSWFQGLNFSQDSI